MMFSCVLQSALWEGAVLELSTCLADPHCSQLPEYRTNLGAGFGCESSELCHLDR